MAKVHPAVNFHVGESAYMARRVLGRFFRIVETICL
jgi:hypothetical protein